MCLGNATTSIPIFRVYSKAAMRRAQRNLLRVAQTSRLLARASHPCGLYISIHRNKKFVVARTPQPTDETPVLPIRNGFAVGRDFRNQEGVRRGENPKAYQYRVNAPPA